MTAIIAYATAFPALRLPGAQIKAAWGSLSAKGLKRKTVCSYDEDPITLAVAAAKKALLLANIDGEQIDGVFLGATTLPYEEKPASATVVTALSARRDLRVVEIRGSRQAGLQALVAAMEFCACAKGRRALAIATDNPRANMDRPLEHAMSAAAAVFVVGAGKPVAVIDKVASTTLETFGGRLRRAGEIAAVDLELRSNDDLSAIRDLAKTGLTADHLVIGLDARGQRSAAKALAGFGKLGDSVWPELGDAGAALTPVELCASLDGCARGEKIIAVAVGGGTTAVRLVVEQSKECAATLEALQGGREITYIEYLKHRRILSSVEGGAA